MFALTVFLFERIGLLLLVAFMLTRIPRFRSLLDRDLTLETVIYHSLLFGFMGILAAHAGVVMKGDELILQPWVLTVVDDEVLISFTLVVVMIAGLLGGPLVGLGAGFVVGVYTALLGGSGWPANAFINPLGGLITGWTARFFSQERVIAANKALFIGIFPPVFHMGLLIMFLPDGEEAVQLVNTIGIPLVVTNCVALAIFTMMIRTALHETEQEAALETHRALSIVEKALPLLKGTFPVENAQKIAELLFQELDVAAISVTNTHQVLAHVGLGDNHHFPGEPLKMQLSRQAIACGEIQVAYEKAAIQCRYDGCPLQTAMMIPIHRSGEVIGLINLYFRRSQQIRAVEMAFAQGLRTLISNQISALEAEQMKELLNEAEMRNLQAQIHPHFLFNTFNLIHSLLRVNPEKARHILVQLSEYVRANLRTASASLIPLEQELRRLHAYLEIIKARFPEQISVSVQAEEGLQDVWVPPSILQPLIENSIHHGLKNQVRGEVVLILKKHKGCVRCEVRDNGSGFPDEILGKLGERPLHVADGNGTALYNINQRLRGLLGKEAQLHFQNLAGKGCVVWFEVPLKRYAKEGEAS